MATGSGVGNGQCPDSSVITVASARSLASSVPGSAARRGKHAARPDPIRKIALTVPPEGTLVILSPRHWGNWSSTSARAQSKSIGT